MGILHMCLTSAYCTPFCIILDCLPHNRRSRDGRLWSIMPCHFVLRECPDGKFGRKLGEANLAFFLHSFTHCFSAYDTRSPRRASASPSEARHGTNIQTLPVVTAPA